MLAQLTGLVFLYEPRHDKTGLQGFRPGSTQTRLYSHRRSLEPRNFGFRKYRDCTIYVEKIKAPISCAATAQLKLISAFIFAYAKAGFLMMRLILSRSCRLFTTISFIKITFSPKWLKKQKFPCLFRPAPIVSLTSNLTTDEGEAITLLPQ